MADDPADSPTPPLSDLLGGPVPFPEELRLTDFKPWHRPRKHFVRRTQWEREIGFLARDMGLADSELRYLTLPGDDLLDIRHLHDTVCQPRKVKLKYLGFNTAAKPADPGQAALNSAEFSVKRLSHIDGESRVFPGDFRELSNEKSMTSRVLRASPPFHAINLDLCGGFAGKQSVNAMGNYFAALECVLYNQRNTNEDFLLFITTRMDADSVDPACEASLRSRVLKLRDACAEFDEAMSATWATHEPDDDATPARDLTAEEHFMVGLTQYVLSRCVALGLKGKVRSLMTYCTGDGSAEDDIVSLAFRFVPDPLIVPDPDGLIQLPKVPTSADDRECSQSAPIPGKVAGRTRVDEHLRSNPSQFNDCTSGSRDLLAASGYDPAAYLEWVATDALHHQPA